MADKRKPIKDETDEDHTQIFEREAYSSCCCDSHRLQQHVADFIWLRDPAAPQTGAGTPPPPTFNGVTTPDNSSVISTTGFFNDPRLTSLIDQALFANQELRILAQDIAIANNEILRRRGAYLPFVTSAPTRPIRISVPLHHWGPTSARS